MKLDNMFKLNKLFLRKAHWLLLQAKAWDIKCVDSIEAFTLDAPDEVLATRVDLYAECLFLCSTALALETKKKATELVIKMTTLQKQYRNHKIPRN